MNSLRGIILTLVALVVLCGAASAEERLKMSTTTSTQDSGLLKVLLPPFEKKNNCKVDVIAVGTGQALKLGEAGDVDVVFVHARKLEDKFVADGFGVNRKDVMYNDFVIIGPKNDPAGIAKAKTAAEALKLIAARQATFVSRGDKSGTHMKELELWKAAGTDPKGSWYIEAGQGMGPVITMATERRGYTLADRGTYNAFKGQKTDLAIVFQGEKGLFNPYGIIAVNPKKFPHVKYDLAMKFIDYVTGPEGLKIISGYKAHGEPVFFIYKK
ncbi:tungstate ABC transporter, periplasmic tungstate-binding protein, putative [Geobacter metallireducens RCH3]|uniref:Tungstate ABC transporter, periplasmic tungstate-binding protein n=1 Tax=Geobacter metallireducens (strain ATCC 53774 / DSM 7210 / GS-15) TaxID=269799 RepID=Q39WU3_GEOMG|nr:substrate-binding domain-containing protein [Geobacter metallireducens]ABB31281.1 tungstate ABC transporter, periplasmic tungstate-binding protein [Geobacter metallireducens GS-15]EHP86528.1 tungstate ABC transporter, periplasmic tungstate-binding protein, putative [Geobacter metallireducens RCH3]